MFFVATGFIRVAESSRVDIYVVSTLLFLGDTVAYSTPEGRNLENGFGNAQNLFMESSVMAQTKAISDFLLGLNPPEKRVVPVPDFSKGKPFSVEGVTLIDLSTTPMSGGEALTGLKSGNSISHSEGFGGDTDGVTGTAYGVTLGRQQDGINNLEAVTFPNKSVQPRTVMGTKVKTDSIFRAAIMFGPVQQAIADAVMAALGAGYFGDLEKVDLNDIRIVILPFIHPNAAQKDENADEEGAEASWVNLGGEELIRANYELYWNNFWAALAVLHEMVTGGMPATDMLKEWDQKAAHPFLGFAFEEAAACADGE